MKTKLVCLSDKIIVFLAIIPTETESGIIMPDSAVTKDDPSHGVVKYIGDAVTDIKVNDVVHFAKFVGSDLHHDGTDYKVMRASDVVAKEVEIDG